MTRLLAFPLVALAVSFAPPASASAVAPQVAGWIFRDAPTDYEWHLKRMRVLNAWRRFEARGRKPGQGVTLAFPDTGLSRHPEMLGPSGDGPWAAGGWDYLEDDDDPLDDLVPVEPWDFPGHATQALSVIVSPRGPAAGGGGPFVTGAAPAARVLPLRVGRGVLITDDAPLARSIRRAVDQGADIVLLARGALAPSAAVERELAHAVSRGVIVIAAAGNAVPFVIYPARHPDVIAVGCSDVHDGPLAWCSPGREVDISAPGSSVWAAYPHRTLLGGNIEHLVGPAGGTTMASSLVAGAAALWLSYHGRDELIARYGAEGTVLLFRQLLRDTARTPDGWPTHTHGAGIVDVDALLAAPLPDARPPRVATR